MIKTGRYCPVCKEKFAKEFGDAAGLNRKPVSAPPRRKDGESKMRFWTNRLEKNRCRNMIVLLSAVVLPAQ